MESMDTITSMKDHHRISTTRDHSTKLIKSHNPNPKGCSWSNSQTSFGQDPEDYMINAFSWPPISYTCSFCKREFRSAQALGGHMNVHRKDRARLRQSPMPPRDSTVIHYGRYGGSTSTTNFLSLSNRNPNPSFSSSNLNLSAAASSLHLRSLTSNPGLSSLASSPYFVHDGSFVNIDGADAAISACGVGSEVHHDGSAEKCQVLGGKSLKKKKTMNETRVRLELEMGLFRDDEEDLDLELRLGFST